ncbi:hypothetical protein [Nisaea sediminum]|nr:hypothetical protein [Nisaea sediminum]
MKSRKLRRLSRSLSKQAVSISVRASMSESEAARIRASLEGAASAGCVR